MFHLLVKHTLLVTGVNYDVKKTPTTLHISKLTSSFINKFTMYLLLIFLTVTPLFKLASFSYWLHIFSPFYIPSPCSGRTCCHLELFLFKTIQHEK